MGDETILVHDGQRSNAIRVNLKVIRGPHAGMSWSFAEPQTVVMGRQMPAHLRLPDESALSRKHLELRLAPPQIDLVDLDSTNGTTVNGMRDAGAERVAWAFGSH